MTNEPALPRTILVTGATGRQGGAVLRHLRKLAPEGTRLRALTRKPERASALAGPNVDVVGGDLDDDASLRRVCEGADALFSIQDPWAHGVPREIEQGERLAAVAKASGVSHIVYTSVATADEHTGVEHFESKGRIERAIAATGLGWTFVRPVFFMDMLLPWKERQASLIWGALFRRDTPIQLIATDDIGAVCARALLDPSAYGKQIIELAADELDLTAARAAFAAATGKTPWRVVVPFVIMKLVNHEAESNFRWIRDHGWHVDVARCRERFPFLQRFPAWIAAQAQASATPTKPPIRNPSVAK